MLKTEQNTGVMESKVLTASKKAFPKKLIKRGNIFAFFEHGQWWMRFYDLNDDRDRTFAVVDAEGPGTYNGFDFEEC